MHISQDAEAFAARDAPGGYTVRIGEKLSVVPVPRTPADGQGGDKKRMDATAVAAVEGIDP